ncbi:MAG TPA: SprT family zinc-dependent metalloprotease [Motiliproteus sp.]
MPQRPTLLESFSLPCRVRTTRRKGSIALRVSREEIRILAPQGTSAAAIERLLHERQRWIEEAVAAQLQRPQTQREYVQGEQLLLNGIAYPLHTAPGARCVLRFEEGGFVLAGPPDASREQRQQAIFAWYQRRALAEWPSRVQRWSDYTGLTPSSLKIRRYRSRWGACTARGQVSLNTLLLMAPEAVLDYVIIHELCHLRHLNHSPAYWALVSQWCPEWRALRRWLSDNGPQLQLD